MTDAYTHEQYMADTAGEKSFDRALCFAAFRRFYGQFVNERTIGFVVQVIGAERIRKSTDLHMNDIPLPLWDRLNGVVPLAVHSSTVGMNGLSLSDYVCIAKEAARIWKERQANA